MEAALAQGMNQPSTKHALSFRKHTLKRYRIKPFETDFYLNHTQTSVSVPQKAQSLLVLKNIFFFLIFGFMQSTSISFIAKYLVFLCYCAGYTQLPPDSKFSMVQLVHISVQ
jgi:hypothetical protein